MQPQLRLPHQKGLQQLQDRTRGSAAPDSMRSATRSVRRLPMRPAGWFAAYWSIVSFFACLDNESECESNHHFSVKEVHKVARLMPGCRAAAQELQPLTE